MSMPMKPSDPAYCLLEEGRRDPSKRSRQTAPKREGCYICEDPEFSLMGLPLCRACPACGGHIAADATVCDDCGFGLPEDEGAPMEDHPSGSLESLPDQASGLNASLGRETPSGPPEDPRVDPCATPGACIICGGRTWLCKRYDVYFCDPCDDWSESRCGDPTCWECVPRPDRPSMVRTCGMCMRYIDSSNPGCEHEIYAGGNTCESCCRNIATWGCD